jgi:hypothetical protein
MCPRPTSYRLDQGSVQWGGGRSRARGSEARSLEPDRKWKSKKHTNEPVNLLKIKEGVFEPVN